MHRITLRWTLAVLLSCSAFGCSVGPQPMTVLAPTYSFNRDGIGITANAEPFRFDAVAAAEP